MKGSSAKPATRLAAAFDGMRGVEERLSAIEERMKALEKCWETGLSASVNLPEAPFTLMSERMDRLEKALAQDAQKTRAMLKRTLDEYNEDVMDLRVQVDEVKRPRAAASFVVPEEMLFTTTTAQSLPTAPPQTQEPERPAE